MKTKFEENALKKIIRDTLWMARRYADGRRTYAVGLLNDAVHSLDELGLSELHRGDDGKRFADDGMFGVYDPKTKKYARLCLEKTDRAED